MVDSTLYPYNPPEWAKSLQTIPKMRLKLAQLPTPIHKWDLPVQSENFQVFIKRDDLTGAVLSGNKVRKLEFLFAEALESGCDCVITGGGIQSNHARAVAVIAKQLGMECHLSLIGPPEIVKNYKDIKCVSNLLLNKLVKSDMTFFQEPDMQYVYEAFTYHFDKFSEILRQSGKNPYTITLGGSSALGCWGYIEAFSEMMEQGLLDGFDDVVIPVGASGSVLGLAIANYLTGSKLKIHGFSISLPCSILFHIMDKKLVDLNVVNKDGEVVKTSDIMNLNDNHIGLGYAMTTEEEKSMWSNFYYPPGGDEAATGIGDTLAAGIQDAAVLLSTISSATGILLDTTFTVKTVKGILYEMKNNPSSFKGNRVLFIHTGGLNGLYKGQLDTLLEATNVSIISDLLQI